MRACVRACVRASVRECGQACVEIVIKLFEPNFLWEMAFHKSIFLLLL